MNSFPLFPPPEVFGSPQMQYQQTSGEGILGRVRS